jgi:hypothetical protein
MKNQIHADESPEDREFPAPPLPGVSRPVRWPLIMYATIVIAFGILAIFVVRYVIAHAIDN